MEKILGLKYLKFYGRSYIQMVFQNMYESILMIKFNGLIYVSDKETEDKKQSIIKNKTT